MNDPTPQEIAERAAEIRREWSPREERVRAGTSYPAEVVASVVALGVHEGRATRPIDTYDE